MSSVEPFPLPLKDEKQYGKRIFVSMSGQSDGMPDLAHFNPDPYLANTRNTPGMTNRINEERFPNNPFPGSHKSVKPETNAADYVNPKPITVHSKDWMKIGMFALAAIGVIVAIMSPKSLSLKIKG